MHSIFQQLDADHQRMQRMLYELNQEIERFSGMHVTPRESGYDSAWLGLYSNLPGSLAPSR